ncbi:MAG: replication protein [Arenicella sp.]
MSNQRKYVPNSMQLPNAVVDDLMCEMSGNELKCFLFIIRKTLGWHKEFDSISISQFVQYTGIKDVRTVKAALRPLVGLGLIQSMAYTGRPNSYSINSELFDKTPPTKNEGGATVVEGTKNAGGVSADYKRKYIPNSMQLPNAVVDELMAGMSGNQLKCFLLIIRQTLGWDEEFDSISTTQFATCTGIKSERTIKVALTPLVDRNLIICLAQIGKTNRYSINPDLLTSSPPTKNAGGTNVAGGTKNAGGTKVIPPVENVGGGGAKIVGGTPPKECTPQNPLKPTNKTQLHDEGVLQEFELVNEGEQRPKAAAPLGVVIPSNEPGRFQMFAEWVPTISHDQAKLLRARGMTDEIYEDELNAYRLVKVDSEGDQRTQHMWSRAFVSTLNAHCSRLKTKGGQVGKSISDKAMEAFLG